MAEHPIGNGIDAVARKIDFIQIQVIDKQPLVNELQFIEVEMENPEI
jgi:hypothetical protein